MSVINISRRGGLLWVLGAASLLVAASASAQTYGGVTLSPGMAAQTLSGVSGGVAGTPGGEINASSYGETTTGPCRGFIAAAPDHTMTLPAPINNLQVTITSLDGGDTTLVISGPGGTFCNDDTVGLNPQVTTNFPAGTYSVWVGSYGSGTNHNYTIMFGQAGGAVTPPPPPPMAMLQTTAIAPTDPMGTISLNTGFLPDPQTRNGTVIGAVDLNATPNLYGGTCRGYAQATPNHMMNLTSAFTYLRVHVRSTSDTTMAIQDPTGGFWCVDDADGLNPVIEGPWQPGLWRIWVGTYSAGTTANYTLDFTEYQQGTATPPPPPPMGAQLMVSSMVPSDPAGTINLATGFLPDPQTRSGTVTGTVALNTTPNAYGGTCRGHAQANPNHIMNLTTAFSYLRVHVRSTNDTTIAIQGPDGQFWCNDDTDGLNPVVEGPWTPGLWRIWVGTYSQGSSAQYAIDFSEFQR